MLARLQQCATLGSWLLALLGLLAGWHWGWPWWGVLLALLTLLWPFSLIAVECALLPLINRRDPSPRPQAAQLLRAFWQECVVGVQVFNWRQPFCAHREPDLPSPPYAQGRQGIVLIHGYVCNRAVWLPWLPRLRAAGVPFIAVNLEPVFGDIDDYTPTIEAAVARLEASTGRPPLIVAHSMGGLAVRAWLRLQRAAGSGRLRAAHIVTIGSPHHGTWVASHGYTRNAHQMRLGSRWLRALAAHEPPDLGRDFTCIYGHCDNVVMPASSAVLPEAHAVHIPGTPHVALIYHPLTWATVMARLDLPKAH